MPGLFSLSGNSVLHVSIRLKVSVRSRSLSHALMSGSVFGASSLVLKSPDIIILVVRTDHPSSFMAAVRLLLSLL